jgi:hypothetical protein
MLAFRIFYFYFYVLEVSAHDGLRDFTYDE